MSSKEFRGNRSAKSAEKFSVDGVEVGPTYLMPINRECVITAGASAPVFVVCEVRL